MRRGSLTALLAATVALAACGTASDVVPGGPGGALIRIEEVGGFMPLELTFSHGPTFTLTTDGLLLSPGAVPAIFPGPLVYPYFASQVTPGEMRQIQAMIERIGLPGMDDVNEDDASDMIADAGTTVITYWDSNGQHRFSVYALGLSDRGSQSARTLSELLEVLHTLSWQNPPGEFQPERIRVIAGEGMMHVDEDFVDVRPWPLADTGLDSWDTVDHGWVCRGFPVDALSDFANASQVTRWTNPAGGPDLTLYVRILHPGEEDCP